MSTCAPTGDLGNPRASLNGCASGHPYVCDCGDPLTFNYTADGLDHYWTGPDGQVVVSLAPAEWHRDPKGFFDRLIEHNPAAYSRISAAYNLGHWPPRHAHRPVSCAHLPHDAAAPPECHDWPMQRVRDGWRCRIAKTLFPFEAAEEEPAA